MTTGFFIFQGCIVQRGHFWDTSPSYFLVTQEVWFFDTYIFRGSGMSPDSSEQNPVSESFGLAQTDLKWIFTSLKASHLKHCINSFFFKLRKCVAEIDIVWCCKMWLDLWLRRSGHWPVNGKWGELGRRGLPCWESILSLKLPLNDDNEEQTDF